jgi:hypothetical protein
MHTPQHGIQQINQARQTAQQLINQTQQGNHQYQMMLNSEQQNIQMLEQILNREKQAAQMIQQSLQSHETAIQRCQEVINLCNQMQQELSGQRSLTGTAFNQTAVQQQSQTAQQPHFQFQTPYQQ